MRVLILDGHPDEGRLVGHLLEAYAKGLPAEAQVVRMAVRDLAFEPNLRRGFQGSQPWEPDLRALAEALAEADHVVLGFPLWWGAEPALVKGLLDRLLLPGFAFKYHRDDPFWERRLAGRSCDLIVTMDTPPWYLRWVWGNPLHKRWTHQILGFCGFAPIRIHALGPTRRGGAAASLARWEAKLRAAAAAAGRLRRGPKAPLALPSPEELSQAVAERKS